MKITELANQGVDAVFDALHGNIDLSDFDSKNGDQVRRIISAPFLQRLRRIKQLGFVSQNFLSATHNRYSHALGTVHIMRKLIRQLEKTDLFDRALPSAYAMTRDEQFAKSRKNSGAARLKQHLIICAAIQDVGELPYEKATAKIFSPGERIRRALRDANVDLHQMSDKDAFTLSFIWIEEYAQEYFEGLNKNLLTYLISGLVPKGRTADAELGALRQMLDGNTIDADRLDYVYRDAFHTIGVHHTPDALIDSIVEYDQSGPALWHVRPITEFIVTRAMLWSNVYLSPENRFRVILLRRALKELLDPKGKHVQTLLKKWLPNEMTPENFLAVDDPFIDALVNDAREKGLDLADANALEILEDGGTGYEYKWVAFSNEDRPLATPISTPANFYWDTYADYRQRTHTLYTPESIRIVGPRYSLLDEGVYLEHCIGPFSKLLGFGDTAANVADTWPALPMPEHMVWFVPSNADAKQDPWRSLFDAKGSAQLTTQLELNDPLGGIDFEPDTREHPDCTGPAIFLAFAWEDREYVSRLASILLDLKRRYFVLLNNFSGYGQSTVKNSEQAVDEAEAVILLASTGYKKKWRTIVEGPIFGEVSRMISRRELVPVVPMGLDSFVDLKDDFPWGLLTSDSKMPFMETNLRGASTEAFRNTVVGVLQAIEKHKKP
ncbi:TIR domain-containing protein [Bradyrhizobium sp. INPA03-11B]|uniref:hypothetical protein n=1 Tax=Bradyrhizobium sp. INPA03-11B TaxID=418598 RepID=UPI0033901FF1